VRGGTFDRAVLACWSAKYELDVTQTANNRMAVMPAAAINARKPSAVE